MRTCYSHLLSLFRACARTQEVTGPGGGADPAVGRRALPAGRRALQVPAAALPRRPRLRAAADREYMYSSAESTCVQFCL